MSKDAAFFKSAGAIEICRAFKRELSQNGRISERGNEEIDEFVREINKLLDAKNEHQETIDDSK